MVINRLTASFASYPDPPQDGGPVEITVQEIGGEPAFVRTPLRRRNRLESPRVAAPQSHARVAILAETKKAAVKLRTACV
jgi:hypothetical protein